MKDTFHPEDWLQQPASTNTTPQESALSGTLEDIEAVTSRIEQSGIDITSGYDNWRNLGFSLSEGLGESGRSYYHRISRLNSGYTPEECDRQYDKCLKSHGTGITVKHSSRKPKKQESQSSLPANPQSPHIPQNPHPITLRKLQKQRNLRKSSQNHCPHSATKSSATSQTSSNRLPPPVTLFRMPTSSCSAH